MQHVLGQVRLHARRQSAPDIFVASISGERDHPRIWGLGPDHDRGLHSAHSGHAQIEQRHVGLMLPEHLHCLMPVGGFGDHGHIGLHVDDGGYTDTRHQVIFSNKNSNFIGHGNGTVTSTSVPAPG